ncbi:DUF1440 domain-containing protein [Arundinibacter roseus]|uniref:DUF1440 domain-containing protein n=1 Tax=Arundinibacter roseus TaxID=2070510 RepID=A0A4R4K763_9BACT|nr:DUF1440 domain-containing protein [Arundinibacter roseus]TDB63348.1 DUF1440 domain-containing protein [Arundinibacter roseus]
MNEAIWKGILAGAVAGLVGTAIKTIWEEVAPSRPSSIDSPPVVLTERVTQETTGHVLPESQKPAVEQSAHWIFGTGIGALYGGVTEAFPQAQKGMGSMLGVALYGATHGSVLPMLNTEPWPLHKPLKFATSEFSGHILYGLTVEFTRKIVRQWLNSRSSTVGL